MKVSENLDPLSFDQPDMKRVDKNKQVDTGVCFGDELGMDMHQTQSPKL